MTNAEDFCQYARLGQTVKIQKCLQSRSIDVNVLNLYGESALSTAVYHNQILCVEYLLANKADPKLRLSAGHTAIHIACRLGNVPILHMLLSIKKDDDNNNNNLEEQQHREDKHVYDCLKIKDNSNLTPIHWAATQESVTKRQKMFAYLDKRMPGVLDSRYDPNWFYSWAKTHSWVLDTPASKSTVRHEESSEITSLDMTPKISTNNYERTPRAPLITTTNHQKPRVQIEQPSILPSTPKTSCKVTVTSIYHIPKGAGDDDDDIKRVSTNSISDHCTYRAHRVHIEPTIDFPPPPPISDINDKQHDYEDMMSPLSNKRPSHNLLSNIVPSVSTTPSSSQQSPKQIASSFGFDTSIERRQINDTTIYSNTDTYEQNEIESISTNDDDDDDNDYEANRFDYICKSTSTLGIASPDTQMFYS